MTKQIDIQELIPFMKDGWVAMDKNKKWWFFEKKPEATTNVWLSSGYVEEYLNSIFDIAPADDWTKSLIKVENKDE